MTLWSQSQRMGWNHQALAHFFGNPGEWKRIIHVLSIVPVAGFEMGRLAEASAAAFHPGGRPVEHCFQSCGRCPQQRAKPGSVASERCAAFLTNKPDRIPQ